MRIATWTVNSLNVRLPRLLLWLPPARPDVLCLQATQLEAARFPRQEIEDAGYAVPFVGPKTYTGVAMVGRPAP